MTTIIGVVGGNSVDPATVQLARQVGREIADKGLILLTGGTYVDEETVKGASMKGALVIEDPGKASGKIGKAIGILPSRQQSTIIRDKTRCAFFVHTKLGSAARDLLNASSPHCLIALAGGAGTLSEIAFARYFKTPLIFLQSLGALKKAWCDQEEKGKFRDNYKQASRALSLRVVPLSPPFPTFTNLEEDLNRLLAGSSEVSEATRAVEAAELKARNNVRPHGYFDIPKAPPQQEFENQLMWLTECVPPQS